MTTTPNTSVLPAIMNFTSATAIEEGVIHNAVYDPVSQTFMCMATIGTKCLKTSMTKYGSCGAKIDKKNEIDDWKAK